MELHLAPGVRRGDDPDAALSSLCDRYLDRIPLACELRRDLAARIDGTGSRAAMAGLHHALAGKDALYANPAYGSVVARLRLAYGQPQAGWNAQHIDNIRRLNVARGEHGDEEPLPFAPPLNRASMVPHPWGPLNPLARWMQPFSQRRQTVPDDVADAPDPRGIWQHNGNIRRLVLLLLMLAQTAFATSFMRQILPYQGTTLVEAAMLALFALLFCWVSAGFWTAMAGFLVLVRGTDRYVISRRAGLDAHIDASARTAIVMPICNEDVARVMAGLRATYESVAKSGASDRFDFYVLSDSSDSDTRSAELAAWAQLCRAVGGFGRIFYRHRRRRVKRKSGNIDDFCRRWGRNYRYMIVLDADSVMSGSCITSLVRLMEANPGAGIIQTAPRAAGRETLYARMQQFATRVYGPLFTAGLHYWQLG
ncbi:MAG TPA: glycosyltransferase, partial [Noviherbaspirillum sp.]